jgi:hypothetical protein
MVRNAIKLPRVKGDSELLGCLAAELFLQLCTGRLPSLRLRWHRFSVAAALP